MKIITYIKYKLIFVLMVLLGINSATAQKKCLVISVDGLSPFAIGTSYTPNIDGLIGNGTYSLEGQTLPPTLDAPGWTSLLTGVWYTKHGVVSESMENYDVEATPDLFTILNSEKPNLTSTAYIRSDTIATYLAVNAGSTMVFGSDGEVANAVSNSLGSEDIADLIFVQMDTTNRAGLQAGFDKTVSEYILAIQYTDELIGQITDAVYNRPTYDDEEWMIIFTSNHGGTEDGEIGGGSSSEKTIPVVISGDDVPNGEVIAKEGQDNAVQLADGMFGTYHPERFDLNDLTIELELKQTVLRGGWQTIFDINNDGTLLALQGPTLKTYGRCGTQTVSEDFRFSIGVNYHVAFTIEGETWKVFIDGEMIGTGETCAKKGTDAYGIGFGAGLSSSPDDQGRPQGDRERFYGVFNEVRVWDTALPDEVIAEYAGQKHIDESGHPFLETGNLVMYLKIDEVEGEKLEDFSGNKQNGSTSGSGYKRVPAVGFQITDIVPTVLTYFGLELDPEWGIDGVPFEVKKVILGPQNDGWNVLASKHYPNPVVSNINIVIPEVMMNSALLTVANSAGVLMTQKSVSGNEIQLGVSHFDPGIYFYSLKEGNNVVLGKFIVR